VSESGRGATGVLRTMALLAEARAGAMADFDFETM